MAPDTNFARAVTFAQDLVRLPSPSGAEQDVAERIVAEMKALHFDDVWTDPVGNVVGRIRGRGAGPSLMLAGHMDVVAAGEPAEWRYPPFAGAVAGGALHGRGAVDVKGPFALQLHAAARFVGTRPDGDLYVAATVFEEEGGAGMAYLMSEGTVRPAGIVLAEATGGDLCIGHRGRAEVVVRMHGRSAHASLREHGVNALSLVPPVLALLDEYDRGLPEIAELGRATITPTSIATPTQSHNVVPEQVEIVADCRPLPGSSAARIAAELQRLFDDRLGEPSVLAVPNTTRQRAYTGHTREFTICSPAFALPPTHAFVRRARAAIGAATGVVPATRTWRFSTDGGHSCGTYGIPTIGYAPGDEALAHTNRECLDLAQARAVFDAYPALIAALQRETAPADQAPAWTPSVGERPVTRALEPRS